MYKFETVYGSQETKPEEIDTTSSEYVVYIRKDIEPYEELDDQEQVVFKGWKYKEVAVPNNEYVAEQLVEQQECNNTLMLAIADLYEMQLGG